MCVIVCYPIDDRPVVRHFANSAAKLPVLKMDSSIELITWGRRSNQKGILPLGGWTSLESIQQKQWDCFFPKMVKLPIANFCERNIEGYCEWYDVTAGNYLQGLLAKEKNELRVYIVTIKPDMPNAIYQRWPKIISIAG